MRHFFGVAKSDLFANKDIIAELKAMNEKFPKDNPLLKSLIMHLKRNMSRLDKMCQKKNIDLLKIFESYDPGKLETINVIKFEYILVETIGMDQKEVKRLIQILDISRKNEVNYQTIWKWMKKPDEIPKYFEEILDARSLGGFGRMATLENAQLAAN